VLLAADPVSTAVTEHDAPVRNWFNLRAGATSDSAHPEVCLEVSPIERLAIEGCGTGSGFLHHAPDPEIAHFRGKWRLASWKTELGWVEPRVSAGFAELQVGEDAPGFFFNGTGPTGVETSGPEAGASVRALYPLPKGFELVGELGLSVGYFEHAPVLVRPMSRVQPSLSFTLGVGF
jgi:hypothetical protein